MRRLVPRLLLVVLVAAPVRLGADEASRAALVTAIHDYRAALERFRGLVETGVEQAARESERRRRLLEGGQISRREWQESERALTQARRQLADIRRDIQATDHTLAEALADPSMIERQLEASRRPDAVPVLVRYRGAARWSLAEMPKVQAFFSERFGRALPVSAVGQTALHDRLGFDHRNGLDVALLPDSAEGTALMTYLREAGISFLAFRARVPGEATGAHIHIGEASSRL